MDTPERLDVRAAIQRNNQNNTKVGLVLLFVVMQAESTEGPTASSFQPSPPSPVQSETPAKPPPFDL
jgi:hypothetical protein